MATHLVARQCFRNSTQASHLLLLWFLRNSKVPTNSLKTYLSHRERKRSRYWLFYYLFMWRMEWEIIEEENRTGERYYRKATRTNKYKMRRVFSFVSAEMSGRWWVTRDEVASHRRRRRRRRRNRLLLLLFIGVSFGGWEPTASSTHHYLFRFVHFTLTSKHTSPIPIHHHLLLLFSLQ